MYDQLKLDNQVCFRLYTASRLVTQAYRPVLEPLGLTYPQYIVMLVLWEKDNQLVGDLCRRLMLDTNTLTPLLQRMEREGFIIRTKGIADGRQTLVSLTKKGQHLEERAKEVPSCLSRAVEVDEAEVQRYMGAIQWLDSLIDKLKVQQQSAGAAGERKD
jgi:DNA-binding MarR family transcriptional regulator